MKILVVGDVYGKVGRRTTKKYLPGIVSDTGADFVIANGENLAGGFGLTRDVVNDLVSCGVDAVTTGNHVWDKKEVLEFIGSDERILRPANYPATAPGVGSRVFTAKSGQKVGVINLLGRVFMDAVDCPFQRADEELEKIKEQTGIIIVDMHCEATSEKEAIGLYLDGRVSAVLGTHTHVQTADEKILTRGTAYLTDLGMTGPTHSVIGVRPEIILKRFTQKLPQRFEEATGPGQFCAAIVEVNETTGRAASIKRIYITDEE
ncbi:Uncharacterized protein YmdB [hydrothermal vent metagenome]|uniref:Uncharacterized protein YmdB n=1 Tax=hydrothermal vent metagenome TaxID=652676 RepID=A0A3B1BNS0_9ZZZZ